MQPNLKIIELASVLAGPLCGTFFAELGCRVLKVENPTTGGDVTRSWKRPPEHPAAAVSAYYASANYNKEVHFRDLKKEEDQAWLTNELTDTDVLILNFKPGSAKKLGLDADLLLRNFPRLIYAEITGFESSTRTAYDAVLQAEGGFMWLNSTPEGMPQKMPIAFIDILAAHQLKEAILLALLERHETEKGKKVSVSLERTALASLANQASYYLMTGEAAQPMGSMHPTIAPYGETFTLNDGVNITMAIGNDRQFSAFCRLINREDLALDSRFAQNPARVENRIALADQLQKTLAEINSEPFLTNCEDQDIPIGKVRSLKEVLDQPFARSLQLKEMIEGVDTTRMSTLGFKPDET